MHRTRRSAVLAALVGGIILAGTGAASADSGAYGVAYGSPGVLSGNVIQIPIHIPINACGNSVGLVSILNPAFGNSCSNGDVHQSGDYNDNRNDDGGRHHEGSDHGWARASR